MFILAGFITIVTVFASLLLLWKYQKPRIRSWNKVVFAWLNNRMLAMDILLFQSTKKKIFSCLHDKNHPIKVVEVGAGTGSNFRYLPPNTEIVCVEPNDYAEKYLLANAAKYPEVKLKEFHVGVGEDLSFLESESMDVVICCHVLCSVSDVDKCLKEALRILKKGGNLCFLEHIEAVDQSHVQFWQHFLKHIWHFLMEGCHLTIHTHTSIEKAGFSDISMEFSELDFSNVPALFRPITMLFRRHCFGVATK